MNSEIEEHLGCEVVDFEGTSFGILDCFWCQQNAEAAFFGIKTAVNQTQTSIVPAALVVWESWSLRVLTHRELVQHGPGLPCDDPITPEFESAVHDYYGTPQPVQIRRGTLRKRARQLSPTHSAAA